jgi:hypothetical protein
MTSYRLLDRTRMRSTLTTACIVAVAGTLLAGAQISSTSQAPTAAGPVDPKLVEDLVAAYRILADQGILDAMGHVSVRHNRNPNRFLMSRAVAPELVTVDDIVEFDLDSNAFDARDRGLNWSGLSTARSIKRGRKAVIAPLTIAHTFWWKGCLCGRYLWPHSLEGRRLILRGAVGMSICRRQSGEGSCRAELWVQSLRC